MTETTVVLVRHGRTAAHASERYMGRTDIGLDACGERQAEVLAAWAAGQRFTSLVCSSMARSRAMIAPVATGAGLPVHVDDRLCELDFGVAEGRTLAELRTMDPAMVDRFLADPAGDHVPGGEAPAAAVDRAWAAIEAAVSADPGGRLVTCAVVGVPLREYRMRLPRVDPGAGVSLLFRENGAPALLAFNVPLAGTCD